MVATQVTQVTQVTQKIQLVEGEFSSFEASNLVNKLIGERINANKVKRLHGSIGTEYCDVNQLNCSINDLFNEKRSAQEIIEEARRAGLNVSIKATLEISIID
jgi:hypothetical protein